MLKNVFTLIATGVSAAIGASVTTVLMATFVFPFGDLVAVFFGTLTTALLSLGVIYVGQYSSVGKNLWAYLDKFRSNSERLLEHYQEVNCAIEEYWLELMQVEFAIDADELVYFSNQLAAASSEDERGQIISKELERRNIDLGFDDDPDSLYDWFKDLKK